MKFSHPFEAHFPVILYEDPAEGLEYVSKEGTAVLAMADGMIIRSGWDNPKAPSDGLGLRIIQLVSLPGFDSCTLFYGHLSDVKVYLAQKVLRGQKIALCGPKTTILMKDRKGRFCKVPFQSDG